jgi:O-methyltransferase
MSMRRTPRTAITRVLGRPVQRVLGRLGYRLVPLEPAQGAALEPAEMELYRQVAPYTMTGPESIALLADAVRHVVAEGVPGAIVECGVWRGGSMMAVAKTLLELGSTEVDLYLMDTFEGMSDPTERDIDQLGRPAESLLAAEAPTDGSYLWARAHIDRVRNALASVGYPATRLHFVKGRVEETLPERAPGRISLLRLDTDWYESTRHELEHLYPRVSPGGVLIVDDYGCWRGAREATDEYFVAHPPRPLLVRFNESEGRIAVKPVTD